jgi:putative transcriptional regulator
VESLRGQLLVAGPTLADPNFHRTVVLVCEHTEEGALGLVLNRRTALALGEAAPELISVVGEAELLWAGGPVQPQSIVLLAEFDDEPDDALAVVDDVALVLQGADLAEVESGARRARAFIGYAGWGPGQLDEEVASDDWIVAPAEPEDPFTDDAETLWSRALGRMGGRYALLATMPPDPSLN